MDEARTLGEMWESACLIADMPNTTFATSAEGYGRVNKSILRAWGMVIREVGEDALKEPVTLTTTANVATTALGSVNSGVFSTFTARLRRVVSMDVTLGGRPQKIEELPDWEMRNAFAESSGWGSGGGGPFFKLENGTTGQSVRWFPTPTAAHSVTAYIIPNPPKLVQSTDSINLWAGFSDYVEHDVAIYLLNREKSDPGAVMMERERIWKELVSSLPRKHRSPLRVMDVRERAFDFGRRGRGDGWWWR